MRVGKIAKKIETNLYKLKLAYNILVGSQFKNNQSISDQINEIFNI